jgi:hypothetical protein
MSNSLVVVAEQPKESVFGFHSYATVGIVVPHVAPCYSMPTFDSLRCAACGFVGCFEDFFVSLPADPLVPDSQPNAFLSCQMCGHKGPFTEVNDVSED